MALPPEKIRAYRPLLDVLVAELVRQFDRELQQRAVGEADDGADGRAARESVVAPGRADDGVA